MSSVLITEILSKSKVFVTEASESGVFNISCTKMVAGEQWFNNFMLNRTEKSMKEIDYFPSSTKFKFGDVRQVTVIKQVFPAVIGGKHYKKTFCYY